MFSRLFLALVAAAAGMLGGMLAVQFVPVAVVQAQSTLAVPSTVQARSFILLDAAGRKRGEWKLDSSGQPALTLFDERGRDIWGTAPGLRAVPLSK
jgi:hypothetical protein